MKKSIILLLLIITGICYAQNATLEYIFQDENSCYFKFTNEESKRCFLLTTYLMSVSYSASFHHDSIIHSIHLQTEPLTSSIYLHQYDNKTNTYYLNLEPYTSYIGVLLTDLIYLDPDKRIISPGQTKYTFAEVLPHQSLYIQIHKRSLVKMAFTNNGLTKEIEYSLKQNQEISTIFPDSLKDLKIRLAYYPSIKRIKPMRYIWQVKKRQEDILNYQIVETIINMEELHLTDYVLEDIEPFIIE